MKHLGLALVLLLAAACEDAGDRLPIVEPEAPAANPAPAPAPAVLPVPAGCADDTNVPPRSLACTGLYAAIEAKTVAPGVRTFKPAVELWSDGAGKTRWIFLPGDAPIDNRDRNEWVFPIGTKSWKEFTRDGRRIETRLWQKVRDRFWVKATYLWNADETAAVQSPGGDITLADGSSYHLPTADECQQCHRGRKENLLGFEAVSLGLPGATGMTLAELAARKLLTVPPAATALAIGDDGTGAAAAPLAWLHVNCGTTCHNANSNAVAYGAGLRVRLDPDLLDGGPVNAFDSLGTTIGVPGNAPAWRGTPRIAPGAPEDSLLYQLISQRGTANQMPPIATAVIDEAGAAAVAAWIRRLPPP